MEEDRAGQTLVEQVELHRQLERFPLECDGVEHLVADVDLSPFGGVGAGEYSKEAFYRAGQSQQYRLG